MSSLKEGLVRPARRSFIVTLLVLDTVVIALAVNAFVTRSQTAFGLGLGAIASTGFLTYLVLAKPARTSRRLWWITATDAVASVVALITWPLVFPIVVIAAGLHFLYTYWYSRLDRSGPIALQVDRPLPDFVVTSVNGQQTTSSQLRQQPRIILFYRGNWCPLCMAQISEIAADYQALERRGYRVTLISPQPSENTEELAERFDVSFDFYTDIEGKAADTLGIKHVGGAPAGIAQGYDGDTVLPTVVITDNTGTVRWLDLTDNYRIRPEPSTFLEVIDSLHQSKSVPTGNV